MWRAKWKTGRQPNSADTHSYLALACMQNGAKVYAFSNSSADHLIPMHDCCAHKGYSNTNYEKLLCYGIDFIDNQSVSDVSNSDAISTQRIASCSFYENSVHTWHVSQQHLITGIN